MIEHLKAKPGVLALRVGEHLSREDIDKCLELFAEAFETHPGEREAGNVAIYGACVSQ